MKKKPPAAPDPELLARAGGILGLPPGKVLFETGYRASNKDRYRLSAAEAELRAVIFLAGEGFGPIALVPRSARPTADILASRRGLAYAVEVRRVTPRSSFSSGSFPAGKALAAKVSRKIKQAGAFRKRGGLARSAVVLVLDPGALSGGQAAAPEELARAAGESAGMPAGTHVCVLAGAAAGVWPPWES